MEREEGRFVVVLTTVGGEEEGARMAKSLVGERLAACVNACPVRSTYRWRGEVSEDPEILLFVKTRAERVEEVFSRIRELHSYELPELLVLPVLGGSEEYLEWLGEEVPPR
ncbi:MAG: dihydroorotate dehydrogenase [Candidatus Binatia bacterium]|nr:MAG: dihydroorotate dehydrogenase [Candidatus Binatia bacterium]